MFMYTCNVTQILPECFRDVVKLDSSLTAVIKKKKKKVRVRYTKMKI